MVEGERNLDLTGRAGEGRHAQQQWLLMTPRLAPRARTLTSATAGERKQRDTEKIESG